MFWPVYHITCQRVLWNGTFLDIYLTTFFEVHKFKNLFKLWASSLFWKCSKLNLYLQNAKRNSENIFHFWDYCIKKCCNKLLLLRREYLLLPVNGLTNSPKILYVTQRDFSPSTPFTEINNYRKIPVVQLWTMFWRVYNVTCQRVLWDGTFYTFI